MVDVPLEQQSEVVIRSLRPTDLDAIVALDTKVVGRAREEYFRLKLDQALTETGIEVSLAAEYEGRLVGLLLGRVFYGEFGQLEQVAVLDTLEVDPDYRDQGIGQALLEQLTKNLHAIRIATIRTEVGWNDQELLSFFHHAGFQPAQRLCLELDLQS